MVERAGLELLEAVTWLVWAGVKGTPLLPWEMLVSNTVEPPLKLIPPSTNTAAHFQVRNRPILGCMWDSPHCCFLNIAFYLPVLRVVVLVGLNVVLIQRLLLTCFSRWLQRKSHTTKSPTEANDLGKHRINLYFPCYSFFVFFYQIGTWYYYHYHCYSVFPNNNVRDLWLKHVNNN